jgi:hypothetical protein
MLEQDECHPIAGEALRQCFERFQSTSRRAHADDRELDVEALDVSVLVDTRFRLIADHG